MINAALRQVTSVDASNKSAAILLEVNEAKGKVVPQPPNCKDHSCVERLTTTDSTKSSNFEVAST